MRWFVVTTVAIGLGCGCNPTSPPVEGGVDGSVDSGIDSGFDAGPTDAGPDSGTDAGQDAGDAGEPADAGFVEAPHDAFPQIPYGGGPVIAHPALVTVTFPDPSNAMLTAEAQAFDQWIASSSWLSIVGADYGVGNGPAPVNVPLDGGPPPWSGSSDIAAFLAAGFDAGTLPAPTPDGGQIYVLYLPSDTPLSGVCISVFGFHDNALYGDQQFAYAVVPDCPESATGFPDLENLNLVASHEIVEAATNPYSDGDGGTLGWQLTDPNNPWYAPGFGEVADVCEGQIWQDPDAGWSTQLIWSNTQAALGTGSPCIPLPTTPYFNVSPNPNTPMLIAAGSSMTIPITGWSTAPVAPWDLTEMAYFGDFDPMPVFADAGIDNDVTQSLTLSVPAGTPSGARTQVWLGSYSNGSENYTSFWPVAVQAQ